MTWAGAWAWAWAWAWAGLVLLAGCSACGLDPQAGETLDSVQDRLGTPSRSWTHPDGSHRLAYAFGSYSHQTCMVDFDSQGRLQKAENVRDEAHFLQVKPGMSRDELEQLLGPPSWTWAVAYHHQTVWSYRFENPFCEVFHVGLTPAGVVEDSAHGPDPICDNDDSH